MYARKFKMSKGIMLLYIRVRWYQASFYQNISLAEPYLRDITTDRRVCMPEVHGIKKATNCCRMHASGAVSQQNMKPQSHAHFALISFAHS